MEPGLSFVDALADLLGCARTEEAVAHAVMALLEREGA